MQRIRLECGQQLCPCAVRPEGVGGILDDPVDADTIPVGVPRDEGGDDGVDRRETRRLQALGQA